MDKNGDRIRICIWVVNHNLQWDIIVDLIANYGDIIVFLCVIHVKIVIYWGGKPSFIEKLTI